MKPEDKRLKAAIREILPRLSIMYREVRETYEDDPETRDMLDLHHESLRHAVERRAYPKIWYEAGYLEGILIDYLTE